MIDDKTKPEYVNFCNVNHSAWEVDIDFGVMYPPLRISVPREGEGGVDAHGQYVARLVMSPGHAKALVGLLSRTIVTFETEHGPIRSGEIRVPPPESIN